MAEELPRDSLKAEVTSLNVVAGVMYVLAAIFLLLAGMACASPSGVNQFVLIALFGFSMFILSGIYAGKKAATVQAAMSLTEGKRPFEIEVEIYGSKRKAIIWLDQEPTTSPAIDPSKDMVITRRFDCPLIIPDGLVSTRAIK